MARQRDAVVIGGARTAIGDYGGSRKDVPPAQLAALVTREAVRAVIDPSDVGMVVFGNVIHPEPRPTR
jgi:acetyl-CoA C-acetyltransferase